ncbi:MAG: choice-of-anchor L domain-containing protein [Fluviicola sp.]|jgi:gliding motility-associated-like protein
MRILILIAFFPFLTFSQLATSVGNPSALVQNTLLGPGVTVMNINYSGSAQAIGSFTAGGTNLGIASGIVMTSGTVVGNASGPLGPNNSSNAGINNGAGGYPPLSALVGGNTTFNAAILEFDFIPFSDTVRFKYVFGSEEYPEYVGTGFNDVFAFFISGPGIAGLQNIARLHSGQAVTINNVNNGNPTNGTGASNPAFFVENGNGTNSPYNSSNTFIQYDGFTKPMQAVSRVQCGETYHLIIAIADVNDGIFDSGIFLEANSLQSDTPVELDYALSFDAYNDGVSMAEGCVSTTVTLTRPSNAASGSLNVPITTAGTATAGVDYSAIPPSVTFSPGQTSLNFTFTALTDVLTEGIETIDLNFQFTDPCGNLKSLPLNLKIRDVSPLQVTVNSGSVLCPGEPLEVFATVVGGSGPYTYLWNTGETTASIFVSPISTQTYTVTVNDNCLGIPTTASGTVTVPTYTPLSLVTTPDIVEICPYVPTNISVTASNGAGNYTYLWTNAGTNIGTGTSIDVVPPSSTSYTITVTDQCGETISETINYTITSPPLVLNMSPAATICPGDPVTIGVTATGGYGQYSYVWPQTLETTAQITVNPITTTTYTVVVSDECQTFTVSGSTTVNVLQPVADFTISSHTLFEDLPITFQNLTSGGDTYVWTFGDGQGSTAVHPNNTYDLPGTYFITLIATNEIGCKDTVVKPITIQEEYWIYVPNTFTPDGNRFNNFFSAKTINIEELTVLIFNRWGEIVFSSDKPDFAWDGTYDGKPVQDGTYVYKIKYFNPLGEEFTILGHVNVIR